MIWFCKSIGLFDDIIISDENQSVSGGDDRRRAEARLYSRVNKKTCTVYDNE